MYADGTQTVRLYQPPQRIWSMHTSYGNHFLMIVPTNSGVWIGAL